MQESTGVRGRSLARVRVPARRTIDIVMTESEDEVLVYDTQRRHLHHLNAITATIWRLCDGTHTVGEVAQTALCAQRTGVSGEVVRLALRELDAAGLLAEPLPAALRRQR